MPPAFLGRWRAPGPARSGVSATATLASVVSFGALIGAGWFGWQRPWAFGLAAAFLGVILFAGIVGTAILQGGVDPGVSRPALFLGLASQESFQLFFGAIAGWYGGYLRRRVAAPARIGARWQRSAVGRAPPPAEDDSGRVRAGRVRRERMAVA